MQHHRLQGAKTYTKRVGRPQVCKLCFVLITLKPSFPSRSASLGRLAAAAASATLVGARCLLLLLDCALPPRRSCAHRQRMAGQYVAAGACRSWASARPPVCDLLSIESPNAKPRSMMMRCLCVHTSGTPRALMMFLPRYVFTLATKSEEADSSTTLQGISAAITIPGMQRTHATASSKYAARGHPSACNSYHAPWHGTPRHGMSGRASPEEHHELAVHVFGSAIGAAGAAAAHNDGPHQARRCVGNLIRI